MSPQEEFDRRIAQEEFDRRIAEIYEGARSTYIDTIDAFGGDTTDIPYDYIDTSSNDAITHYEFQAMVDVFLGEDYDLDKRSAVEKRQILLHRGRAELYQSYEAQELTAEEYVDRFNTLLANTFAECEAILGENDFVRLFGARPHELGGFIDKHEFVIEQQRLLGPHSDL